MAMELRALQRLAVDGGAFALALPGADGRALHARGQDGKRVDKITSRMAAILVKLVRDQPLDPKGDEYKTALGLLRDQEVKALEKQIEVQAAGLAALRLERQQAGAASSATRSITKRAAGRRKRIRQLLAVMKTWQQSVDMPPSPVMQCLPAQWKEEVVGLMKGSFPWRAGYGEKELLLGMLAERYRDACAEVSQGSNVHVRGCALCSVCAPAWRYH